MLSLDTLAHLVGRIRTWLGRAPSLLQRQALTDNDWQADLRHLGSELDALGSSTEGEFLTLGETLQGFHQRAGAISKISSSVAQLMAGEEMAAVIDGFRQLISRVEGLEGESQRNATTLQQLLAIIGQLHGNLSSFDDIVRTLRVLGVSIRIESARLGERDIGFKVLADEVVKLAFEIEEKYSHLLAKTRTLSRIVGQTLTKVADLEGHQHARAGILLDKTLASLEPLTEKQRQASTITAAIATRYDSISRNVGEIVASMQFHDITRQRIEHAREAFDSMASERPAEADRREREKSTEEGPKAACPTLLGRCLSLVGKVRTEYFGKPHQPRRLPGGVCELQIAQLNSARDVVVSAVENIVTKLAEVVDIVTEMSQETRKMAGAADETGSSCLSELETAFASVTSALSAYAATDRDLSLIMGSMEETLGDMASFAGAIEEIGERIKRLALNAIVKAAHIGDAGLTLGVLAESVHQLSVETRCKTEIVSDALRSMTTASMSQRDEISPDMADRTAELESAKQVVRTLLSRVQQVNQEIATLLGRIHEQGSALSEVIRKTLAGVKVHHQFDSVISAVVAQLEAMVAASRLRQSAAGDAEPDEQLRVLEAAYTMEEERQVHHSILTPAEAPQESDVSPAMHSAAGGTEFEEGTETCGEEAEEDLGDNVELF